MNSADPIGSARLSACYVGPPISVIHREFAHRGNIMPEGHTIHRLARDHQKWFAGHTVAICSPQGRFAPEARKLNGKKLLQVSARGKHLFYHFPRDQRVHVHLGLYGKFRLHKNPAPQPRGAVRIRMVGSERTFDLNGPNRCRLISKTQHEEILKRLGQDPLDPQANPEAVWDRFQRSRSPLGTLLLNQSVIAGVGNVYRAEILFLLGLDPRTPANQLDRPAFDELWNLTVELLQIGEKYNRIITVDRNSTGKPLSRLKSGERLQIYKKERCPNCNGPVQSWELGSRKMYACPNCQKS